MDKSQILAALLLAGKCVADIHHLFTSSYATPHLYALEFDDQRNTLQDIANLTAHDGHPWISFSYDKASLYAGENDGFASYTVENSTSLLYSQSVKVTGECGEKKNGLGSPYVVAELRAPFTVFGASASSCGAALSVDAEGKLQTLAQAFKYKDGSSIKGLALDPDNKYLYSADEANNGIWSHLVNDQGTVNQVGFTPAPFPNSEPRHLVVHPDGRYLYAVLSKSNSIAVFAINSGTGSDATRLTFTGTTYTLTPPGAANSDFVGEDVLLSADANVLFGTTRFVGSTIPKSPTPKPTATSSPSWPWGSTGEDDDDERVTIRVGARATRPGYVTAILLTPLAERESPANNRLVGSGFPLRPIFQLATTTSGGISNSISPAPSRSSEYFALADSEYGLIEIWKINNLAAVDYNGTLAEGARNKPIGGWVQNNWSSRGSLLSAPAPDRASQPAQPYYPSAIVPNTPVNAWPTYQAGGPQPWTGWGQPPVADPWAQPSGGRATQDLNSPGWRGGVGATDSEERTIISSQPPTPANSWTWESTGAIQQDQELEAPLARKSFLNRWSHGFGRKQKRQFGASSAITARIVASWRAPVGGGSPGRKYVETAPPRRFTTPHAVRVKPWTGSKKRDIEQTLEEAAPGPTTEQLAAYIKAQSEGKSCCTNAAWFD